MSSYSNKRLWLVISILLVGILACKSREKTSPTKEAVQIIEQPKPATEYQTDSLKKSLDEQRKTRNSKKEKGAD